VIRLILVLTTVLLALPGAGWAGTPPSGPLTLLVGMPPGTATDSIARVFAEAFGRHLGRAVEVENRTGARGNLAAEALARAAPDGHTLGIVSASTLLLNRHLSRQMGYDPQADLTPISRLVSTPLVVLVAAGPGIRTLGDLADNLKARPGACGSAGAGSVQHLTLELLLRTMGARCDMLHFRGARGAFPELISGGVQVYVESAVTGLPWVREGRLRPLAVTSRTRSTLLPEVPTVGESVPGFEAEVWLALMGPRGLPEALTARFEAAAIAAAREPAVVERLRALGADPVGGTAAELVATMRAQDSIWGPVARAAGVTAD
jgi:tripartite-type tricarboxylate transporter receptor subunit TctC